MAGNIVIGIGGLEAAIKKAVGEYCSGVAARVKAAAPEVAEAAKKKIVADSPVGDAKTRSKTVRSGRRRNRYKQDWRVTKRATGIGLGLVDVVISNNQSRLTHLLEDGHAMRQGGRARAFPHIRKHREEALREFEKRCEEAVKNER